ncbi:hypothetical protein PGTUg99_017812 [Puccinia graminis f. sp. tritici]|uniref:Uncharacterized protein n=1 Tax=Puccinia graminis f. sp. tritici TaxID=56615 RepID=A0A5B0RF87_PUCGR|nr:hypothetical protein PGTUg99_017812 [Puccinia graminis f. sp. tritici]
MTRAMIQQMQNVKTINEPEVASKTSTENKTKVPASTSGSVPISTTTKEAAKHPPVSKKKKGKKKK